MVDSHEEEELEAMEFGMRIARTTKTAFNRQILESVHIQSKKTKHIILNSKSEYNRCALPRLTAKMGEASYDKMEKEKIEEKEAEKKLKTKIRNLKIKKSKEKRETTSRKEQPAEKKRKITEDHMKVIQEERKKEKIKLDTEDKNNKYYDISDIKTKKKRQRK